MRRWSPYAAILFVSPVAADVSTVSAGRHFSIIQRNRTHLEVLGANQYGQLGNGKDGGILEISLPESAEIQDVAAGGFHTLFLTTGGAVYSSGRNGWGQLARGNSIEASTPVVSVESGVRAIAAGYGHSIVLMEEDRSVKTAGYNNHGQLGLGHHNPQFSFETVTFPAEFAPVRIKAIAAGYDFSYFLAEDGTVFATGQNLAGQLGDGTARSANTARKVMVPDGKEVLDIAAGESHGLFLTADGVYGTGATFDGQLGELDGMITSPTSAFNVTENYVDDVSKVYAGGDTSCFKNARGAFGFGSNRDGQLGLGELVETVMEMEEIVTNVETLAIGSSHSLFVTTGADSAVLGTGRNRDYEIGYGLEETIWHLANLSFALPPETTTTTTNTNGPATTSEEESTSETDPAYGGKQGNLGEDYSLTVWMVVIGLMGFILACGMLRGKPEEESGVLASPSIVSEEKRKGGMTEELEMFL